MKVTIVANVAQQEEILLKKTNADVTIIFIDNFSEINAHTDSDVFLFLKEDPFDAEAEVLNGKPVFINLVIETLEQKKWPSNFNRINGWPGFLQRNVWEVASGDKIMAENVFKLFGWKFVFVKDGPGLVSARVISMIINEAFFALEEKVSTIEEIDLAMKLGTNYSYGPFEWLNKIGVQEIYNLLATLSVSDKRYYVAPLLQKKYSELSLPQ
jgi:3-hydroxybutyryl-CoA dehydrogenase